jgi:hypothetical protein
MPLTVNADCGQLKSHVAINWSQRNPRYQERPYTMRSVAVSTTILSTADHLTTRAHLQVFWAESWKSEKPVLHQELPLCNIVAFKWALSRDFRLSFFIPINPRLVPDNHTKIFSNLVSISQRYSRISSTRKFWLGFHTDLHRLELQKNLLYKRCTTGMPHNVASELCSMRHSAEFFFGIVQSQNTNLSALVKAVKATV